MAPLSDPGLAVRTIATPIGELTVVASSLGVREVRWGRDQEAGKGKPDATAGQHLERAVGQLDEYFRGRRREFDVPLDLEGTGFQRQVWRELAGIPFGETRTYGSVAGAIGRPSAARAVGAATGRNPAPIIVPCHRIVGTSGALTGFAGGLDTKRALLAHEAALGGEGTGRLPGF